MNDNNLKPRKPVFLYVVITVLSLALAALGILSFFSLNELASLQSKVTSLEKIVQDTSDSASALTQQAERLDELTEEELQLQTTNPDSYSDSQTQDSQTEADTETDGTLSPSNGTSFTDNTDESMDNLLSQVKNLLPTDNGTWSVYVCNLLKNSQGVINDTPMQAASLIKLFIMGTVYENYEQLSTQYGGDTLDSNLNAMITVSDNDAANTLVGWLGNGDNAAGMAKVNAFCKAHGYTSTSMGRMLLESNASSDNYTSAKDCGSFLKEIYQICNGSTDGTLANADAMYYLLKAQQRKNKIPAQLPDGVHAANKTGELSNVENDAGIIYDAAKGIDLVICFMSQDLTDTASAQSVIAADSRAIYGYYNE